MKMSQWKKYNASKPRPFANAFPIGELTTSIIQGLMITTGTLFCLPICCFKWLLMNPLQEQWYLLL